MVVYNINWVEEDGNEYAGTALFTTREAAEAEVADLNADEHYEGYTFSVGELLVVVDA